MTESQKEFDFAFRESGGLFYNGYDYKLNEMADEVSFYIRKHYPNLPKIHFDFINNSTVNARVTKHGDSFFIGVHTGLYFLILDMFAKFFSTNDTFIEIGNIALESPDKKVLNALRAGKILYYSEASLNFPKDSMRAKMAMKFGEIAIRFILFHELGHIIRGHVGYACANTNSFNWAEFNYGASSVPYTISSTNMQTLEMDADSFAVNHFLILAPLYFGNWKNIDDQFKLIYKDWESFCFYIGFILFSVFKLFGIEQVNIEMAKKLSHPPSGDRYIMLAGNIISIFIIDHKEQDLSKMSAKINEGAMYAETCFSKITYHDDNYDTLREAARNHFEYRAEIMNNWNNVHPLLEPFAYGVLPPLTSFH